MAKSKKISSKKTANRAKTEASDKTLKGKRASKKPGVPTSKQAKPNLQPARIIKKPEAAPVSPGPLEAIAPQAEILKQTETTVTGTPAPENSPKNEVTTETAPTQPAARADKPADKPNDPEVIAAQPLEASISSAGNPRRTKPIKLPPSVRKLRSRRFVRQLLTTVAVLLLGAIGVFLYLGSSSNANDDDKRLISEVSRRVVIPEDETPTITTVVDETKVNQEFLRGTKKGDKVLLYFQAGRAIVYRESSDQVVNMGPIETPTPRVFLRDGSTSTNLNAVIDKLRASNDFILTSRDASPKKTHEETVVVDVAGNRPDVAQRLAEFIGARVVSLPDGESKPDADLLVIVGSDQTKQ